MTAAADSGSCWPRVAIIGGGVTGAVCALELLRRCNGEVHVTVFDQGRGLGGRCCHRRLQQSGDPAGFDEASAAFVFDHGCQHFHADSGRFCEELLEEWLERGWVAVWKARFGSLRDPAALDAAVPDFFGVPLVPPVYCGVGGMNALPIGILEEAKSKGAEVRPGVRVTSTQVLPGGGWVLRGVSGTAAFHDSKDMSWWDVLGEFEAVVLTDVSASMGSWHRASAGVPETIASRVRNRTRVVLFTALLAFEEAVEIPLDAVSVADDTLWFAARTGSKPGLSESTKFDCWTLVSTPKYGAAEVQRVPMQDPKTGAFQPQDPSYLREGPCAVLLTAFERMLVVSGHTSCVPLPKLAYVGGQRWGSAFPAPAGVDGRDRQGRGPSSVEVLGVTYDGAVSLALTPTALPDSGAGPRGHLPVDGIDERDYLVDDELQIYYAGDYLSNRLPGVEAAALSGLDAARHLAAVLVAKARMRYESQSVGSLPTVEAGARLNPVQWSSSPGFAPRRSP